MFVKKTQAEIQALTPDEATKYFEAKDVNYALETKNAIDLAVKGAVSVIKTEIETANDVKMKAMQDANKVTIDVLTKSNTDLEEVVVKQGEVIKGLKSIESKKVICLEKAVEDNFEEIKKSKGNKKETADFVIKADTFRSAVVGNANAMTDVNIGSLAHRKLTIYDLFPKMPLSKDMNGVYRYYQWNQATIVRAAAAVAEGAIFPVSDAKWEKKEIVVKKIGDMIPVSEEALYDIASFTAELDMFLRTNMAIKIDTDLVSGDGLGDNISGITTIVPAYVPVASGIQDASIYDLIVKLREAVSRPYGSKFSVNFALMNITDINKMQLKKDAHNNYILPPFYNRDGLLVDNVLIIECNAMTPNTIIVGDNRYGMIIEEGAVELTVGYATGDFETDMQSIKARQRLNLLIRAHETLGFLKVNSISAALVTLAT